MKGSAPAEPRPSEGVKELRATDAPGFTRIIKRRLKAKHLSCIHPRPSVCIRGRNRFVVAPLTAALVCTLAAQEPPVFRGGTRVVEVTVVATRGAGTVNDLQAAEIKLRDNGREQALATFERISSGRDAPTTGRPRIASVVLLDALNTRWADGAYARGEVERTLAQIRSDERAAVYVLGNGLNVLHDPESPYSAALSYEDLFLRPRESRTEAAFYQSRRILDTFSALEAIAGELREIPGRKNLLWVSAGFPLVIGTPENTAEMRTFGAEMDRAVRALSAANITVYPIDARGVTPGSPYVTVSTMLELAHETGGKAYYNRNDIHQAVREALDDSRSAYVLTYSPRPLDDDGSYHRIRVETTRPGVQLRYRLGYYAPAQTSP